MSTKSHALLPELPESGIRADPGHMLKLEGYAKV